MSPTPETPNDGQYPTLGKLSPDSLTASMQTYSDGIAIPLPDGATQADILAMVDALEPHLSSPVACALCTIAIGWYLDTLTDMEATDLTDRLNSLIDRLADPLA